MGHYRSEMGYEADDKRRAKDDAARRKKLIAKIQNDIDKKGIATVLADFVERNSWLLVKYD